MRILIYFKTIDQSPQTYFFGPVTAYLLTRGSHGRDRMVVGFITTYAISAYHHLCCDFESHSDDTTICDQVSQWLATCRWFSPGTPLSSTNKTDRHDNWNIVERGVKHHNFPPLLTTLIALIQNKSPKVTRWSSIWGTDPIICTGKLIKYIDQWPIGQQLLAFIRFEI